MNRNASIDVAWTARRYRCLAALLFASTIFLARPAPAADIARDPIEGKWFGTAGSVREKVDVGLEFRRDANGKLVVRTTEPIINMFDMDLGGEVKRDGDAVAYEPLFLNLKLDGDTLTGTFPGPNSPATLKRATRLPTELSPPKVPTGPGPRWETRLSGQAYASPVVRDGVAYIGTTGGVFNAIDTKDGSYKWTFTAGRPIYAAAAVTDDAVYFPADNGFLFKLERATGKETWRYDLGDGAAMRVTGHPKVYEWDWQGARPLVADDVVYIGDGNGVFHAIDAKTGTRAWTFSTRGRIRNGAAVDDTRVYVGSADHVVYALDRKTGKEAWRHDTGAEVDNAPVVHDGRVLVGNRGAGLFSLAADTGELKWRLFFWGSWVESTPTVSDGVIYIGASDLRRVSAINPDDGHVLWRTDVFGWTFGTPLVVDDRLYVGAAGGTPYFINHRASFTTLDRKTGRILTRWPIADAGGHQWGIMGSPVRSGDTVVVASLTGSLYGFPL